MKFEIINSSGSPYNFFYLEFGVEFSTVEPRKMTFYYENLPMTIISCKNATIINNHHILSKNRKIEGFIQIKEKDYINSSWIDSQSLKIICQVLGEQNNVLESEFFIFENEYKSLDNINTERFHVTNAISSSSQNVTISVRDYNSEEAFFMLGQSSSQETLFLQYVIDNSTDVNEIVIPHNIIKNSLKLNHKAELNIYACDMPKYHGHDAGIEEHIGKILFIDDGDNIKNVKDENTCIYYYGSNRILDLRSYFINKYYSINNCSYRFLHAEDRLPNPTEHVIKSKCGNCNRD